MIKYGSTESISIAARKRVHIGYGCYYGLRVWCSRVKRAMSLLILLVNEA